MITIVNVTIGFGAILLMLGTLRWRQHVQRTRTEMRGRALRPSRLTGELRRASPIAADRDRV